MATETKTQPTPKPQTKSREDRIHEDAQWRIAMGLPKDEAFDCARRQIDEDDAQE